MVLALACLFSFIVGVIVGAWAMDKERKQRRGDH